MHVHYFQFGAAALGGLAAISAGLTQTRADNVNHHVGNTDGDISLLQLRVSDLENTNGNIQSNLNAAQIAANNAVTLAQLDTVTTTTKDAQRMIDRFCNSVSCLSGRVYLKKSQNFGARSVI